MMEKGIKSVGAADSADGVDAHTVFVRSLPFSLTDSQLEDVFSEVGPVRHCFTVKAKGSTQHRGFGFVQFAVTEDAHRAVQEKNGALLQGRKIKVEVAKRRAPLDVRHPKSEVPKPTTSDVDTSLESDSLKVDSKKRKSPEVQAVTKNANGDLLEGKKKLKSGSAAQSEKNGEKASEKQKESKKKKSFGDNADHVKENVEQVGSLMQRPARTVVVGGLVNTEMLEAVHEEAKKAGPIEVMQKTMTELELNSRGLAKDGCKPRAAAIVFLSVKAARQAVAMLHQKAIAGGVVWARQLGGEGSKLKQLRLIIRNLPFQVTEATLRELFAPAGFVWEVTIPRKPDGLSKGFAFIGFTSKVDAEKAIKLVNGKLVAKRPVAVDWAVAKKEFEAAVTPAPPAIAPEADLDESESTASESEPDENDAGDSESDEEAGNKSEDQKQSSVIENRLASIERELKEKEERKKELEALSENQKQRSSVIENQLASIGIILKEKQKILDAMIALNPGLAFSHSEKLGLTVDDDKHEHIENMDREEEIDMVKKVMSKVVRLVPDYPSDDEEIDEELDVENPTKTQSTSVAVKDASAGKAVSVATAVDVVQKVEDSEPAEENLDSEESKLNRTVFIRNLPPEAKVPELRKLFSEFGEIKSFRLVLHPVTKKSKGNAFLEYKEREAAQGAVAAASKDGADKVGLMLKGRALIVSIAVDKNSARKIAKETFHKQVEEDKRNLALAKEGHISMGTPAAAGVSKKDMAKRQQLEHEKATKLRSPNFHVSKIRLLVHNIPKTMTEKELKTLFIEGVKSRASKQNPVIKQVKILRDEDSQKSRGAAFVEFTEHQHALVALRVLNNNPATFTAEHRPIIEFAIENSLILRKRAANAVQAKSKGTQRHGTDGVNNGGGKGKKIDKRHQEMREAEKSGIQKHVAEDGTVKKDRKRKRGIERLEARKSSKVVQEVAAQDDHQVDLANVEIKPERKIKKGKTSGADRKAAQAKRAASEAVEQDVKSISERKTTVPKVKRMGKKGNKIQEDRLSQKPKAVRQPNLLKKTLPKASNAERTEPLQSGVFKKEKQREGKLRKNRRKGGDTEDQLDKLVAEYRTKYFSGVGKPSSSKGAAVASGDLRRWFE